MVKMSRWPFIFSSNKNISPQPDKLPEHNHFEIKKSPIHPSVLGYGHLSVMCRSGMEYFFWKNPDLLSSFTWVFYCW